MPNLVDKFVQGSSTAGSIKEAGLPNITGGFNIRRMGATGASAIAINVNGAFSTESLEASAISLASSSENPYLVQKIRLDASGSSPIYGNSNTVQPPALTLKFAIYSGVVSKKCWLRTI